MKEEKISFKQMGKERLPTTAVTMESYRRKCSFNLLCFGEAWLPSPFPHLELVVYLKLLLSDGNALCLPKKTRSLVRCFLETFTVCPTPQYQNVLWRVTIPCSGCYFGFLLILERMIVFWLRIKAAAFSVPRQDVFLRREVRKNNG